MTATKVLIFILAMFVAVESAADGSLKIGGSMVQSTDSLNITSAIKQKWEHDKWQYDLDSTFNYQKSGGSETTNKYYNSAKVNYAWTPKGYTFALASIDHNKFRIDKKRHIGGIGYGYKLLRTKRFKASNEFSIATLKTDELSEAIWRNSLWFQFKVSPSVLITNKYLVEDGNYSRNQTSVEYKFENGITVGAGNLYTEDTNMQDNISTFNIGYSW